MQPPPTPIIRLSTPADRDAILAFILRMGFNPRDDVTGTAFTCSP